MSFFPAPDLFAFFNWLRFLLYLFFKLSNIFCDSPKQNQERLRPWEVDYLSHRSYKSTAFYVTKSITELFSKFISLGIPLSAPRASSTAFHAFLFLVLYIPRLSYRQGYLLTSSDKLSSSSSCKVLIFSSHIFT